MITTTSWKFEGWFEENLGRTALSDELKRDELMTEYLLQDVEYIRVHTNVYTTSQHQCMHMQWTFDDYINNFVQDLQMREKFDQKFNGILNNLSTKANQIISNLQEQLNAIISDEKTTELGKPKREYLKKEQRDVLLMWLMSHLEHPYPNEREKTELMMMTGLTLAQISNWFINQRRRLLKKIGIFKIQPPHITKRRQLLKDIENRMINNL